MVVQPFIQKPITKLCHKIFGEPKAYLAKQNAASGDGNKLAEGNNANQQTVQSASKEVSQSTFDPSKSADTNLIKKWTQQPVDKSISSATSIQSSDSQPIKPQQAQSEIPAFNLFDKDKKQDRYIPSIEPYIPVDNSKELNAKVDEILKRTDKVIIKTKKSL